MGRSFNVALTADFFSASGEPKFADLGLDILKNHAHIHVRSLSEHRREISTDQLAGVNGVIVLTPLVTRETVARADELLMVGRFGVGYDNVDVAACSEADVLACITAGAVDRSVAEAAVGWMIGLTHHVLVKDRLLREGRWDERSQHMGHELRGRTFGAVGLGGIARETIRLLRVFGMNPPVAFDPYVKSADAAALGVQMVSLDDLLRQADFVSIHCPLTDQTRGLIGARELALMKPQAYLINTARGGIVDEDALHDALEKGRIAGAAIDCFEGEPVTHPHRFAAFDNALLAPHSIAWTNELFRDIGQVACQAMVDLSRKRRFRGVLNPELFDRLSFQRKWERVCGDC